MAMHDIWLCEDCMFVAVNGDASGLDYSYSPKQAAQKLAAIEAGLEELGPNLVPAFDGEGAGEEGFSHRQCDCCGTRLAGGRYEFAILAEGEGAAE